MAQVGVIVFPGTTGDQDALEALRAAGADPEIVWHTETDLEGFDAVVLPGGSSHGDALRPGSIAARTPIITAVRRHAEAGGRVLGIGNGFQILTEAGLLPGALLPNASGRFVCDTVGVRVDSTDSAPTASLTEGEELRLPIAHGHGRYVVDELVLGDLRRQDRILLSFLDDPNGSVDAIAAICDEGRGVVGTMVRPERAIDPLLGGEDGLRLLRSFLDPSRSLSSSG